MSCAVAELQFRSGWGIVHRAVHRGMSGCAWRVFRRFFPFDAGLRFAAGRSLNARCSLAAGRGRVGGRRLEVRGSARGAPLRPDLGHRVGNVPFDGTLQDVHDREVGLENFLPTEIVLRCCLIGFLDDACDLHAGRVGDQRSRQRHEFAGRRADRAGETAADLARRYLHQGMCSDRGRRLVQHFTPAACLIGLDVIAQALASGFKNWSAGAEGCEARDFCSRAQDVAVGDIDPLGVHRHRFGVSVIAVEDPVQFHRVGDAEVVFVIELDHRVRSCARPRTSLD